MGIYLREDIEKTKQIKNNKLILTKLIKIMKKVIFALAAVVALAACSNEETLSLNQGEVIGFDSFTNNVTRSVNDPSLNNSNLADFAVYGTVTADATAHIFNRELVNKQITNAEMTLTEWKYEGTQYWINGATYNFAAVAPYAASQESIFDGAKTAFTFTSNDTTDLLYAQTTATGAAAGSNNVVAFDFRHTLSKIKFSFKNGYNADNATIVVKGINITNAPKQAVAEFTATTTVWSGHTSNGIIAFGDATDNEATTGVKEDAADKFGYDATYESLNERFLIPVAEDYTYLVDFVVELWMGGTKIDTYTHTGVELKFAPAVGTAYDVTTTLTPATIDPSASQDPIQFTVNEIPGWQNGSVGALPLE